MVSYWSSYYDTEQSFVNTSYNEKHTLDFTVPAQGDYLILVSFMITTNNTSYSIFHRAQLDDTITIMEGGHETLNANNAYDYRNMSTIYLAESLASGAHYVDIDAYVNGATGYMKYVKIIVLRLDDWLPTVGMYDYEITDGEYSFAGADTWYDVETLTFTPDTGGDYLILGSIEVSTLNLTKSVSVRLDYDSASEYIPINQAEETHGWCTFEAKELTDYYSWVWGGIVNIPASSKTIKLQAINHGNNAGKVRRRRIFVMRIGAMCDTPQYNEVVSNTSTTGPTYIDKAIKTWTATAIDHLILSGIVIKPDSGAEEGKCRLQQTAGVSIETIAEANVDAKDPSTISDCLPLFTCKIKELSAASQTFKSQWAGRATGDTVYSKASWVVIADIEEVAAADGPNEKQINRLINARINDRIN